MNHGLLSTLTACLCACTVAACGSDRSSTETTQVTPPVAHVAQQQLSAAAAAYNAGAATFSSRTRGDARAGNFTAFKADVAGFGTVVSSFDAAVRKIAFPAAAQTQLTALLNADQTTLTDLDAVGAAKGASEAVGLYNRAIADTNSVIAAEQDLYAAS